MPEYQMGNKTVVLRPADVVGQGGEADIYRKGLEAYKVFKQPNHPDFQGDTAVQTTRARR